MTDSKASAIELSERIERETQELKLLEPFWNKPGVTKAQAVAAYREHQQRNQP